MTSSGTWKISFLPLSPLPYIARGNLSGILNVNLGIFLFLPINISLHRISHGGKFFGDFKWNKKNFPRAYILPILRLFLRKLVALLYLHFSASETDASKYKGKYYDGQIRRQQLNRKL